MELRDISINAHQAALADGGRDKLLAAVDEAEAGLQERYRKTEEEDARRSEELGVPIKSEAVYVEIQRMLDTLQNARMWAETDIRQAFGALNTFVGSPE